MFGSFVARQVEGLRAAGARVTVVANTDRRRGAVRAALKYASLARRTRAAVRSGEFDVVVGHYLYPTASFALDAATRAAVPLVLVSHGTDARSVMRSDRFGARGREALRRADLVVAVSDALRDTLRAEAGVPPEVPIEVVNMGFNDDLFVPDPRAREALKLDDPAERIVLFAGNLEHVKGVEVLFEAFVELIDAGRADRLVLVGDGPLAQTVRERVAALAADDAHADPTGRVTLTGELEQRDVARWMAAADVFVLPSRAEGLGLVLLEAMACGTPCVASRVGGIPEVLSDSCGRLVPAEEPHALAAAIAAVLASGKDTFRDACIERASGHTSEAKAREFLAHVERVVGRDGPED